MEAERAATHSTSDVRIGDDLMEGPPKRRCRIRATGRCGKEGRIRATRTSAGPDETAAALESRDDIEGNRHEPRFGLDT